MQTTAMSIFTPRWVLALALRSSQLVLSGVAALAQPRRVAAPEAAAVNVKEEVEGRVLTEQRTQGGAVGVWGAVSISKHIWTEPQGP